MNQEPIDPQPTRKGKQWWRVSALTVAVFAVLANCPMRATIPEKTTISNILGSTSELFIRRSGQRESAQVGSIMRQIRDALITSPPNNARAVLRFLAADNTDLNMYIQTNSHSDQAIYHFPCRLQGGDYLIGWGLVKNGLRGCEQGLTVMEGTASAPKKALTSPFQLVSFPIAQTAARQFFYCSAIGENGSTGFATTSSTSSNDPCAIAVQRCQESGATQCEATTTGFWWTTEKQLKAQLTCAGDQSVVAQATGETIKAEIESLLEQNQGQSCSVRVSRPQDFEITPAPDDVVLDQKDDEILVQTQDTDTGLIVDVLQGAINVRSSNEPELRLLKEGERYVHSNSGSGKVTTFDRDAALKSIDMEVLCAFASYEENDLRVAACNEASFSLSSGQGPVTFCNLEQASGGQEGDRRTIQMSSNQGELKIEYEMYSVPDRMEINYEGKKLVDTGFTSGSKRLSIPYSGQSGRMEVILTGNQETSGTLWNYILRCP
ncbi:MAG: hypothetical protein ACRC8A_16385 [Microcoleaceae cyanobacterium]